MKSSGQPSSTLIRGGEGGAGFHHRQSALSTRTEVNTGSGVDEGSHLVSRDWSNRKEKMALRVIVALGAIYTVILSLHMDGP